MEKAHFTADTFAFLSELKANNTRDWFEKNKSRYRTHVQQPAMQFVTDFAPRLKKISPNFRADPRPVGGSMFRIHRDTRFSKDKSPYKTALGIQFRHDLGRDAHTPGYYLHIAPGDLFVGAGIWHPDSATLKKIRQRMIAGPAAWRRAVGDRRFAALYELKGESLVRAPAGVEPDHPLIEDLRRKDFIGVTGLTRKAVTGPGFMDEFVEACRAATPLVRYLCRALDIPF